MTSIMDSSNPPPKRQRLSCTECVKKKRKCDRVKPCSACCFQGAPDRCKYAGNFAGLTQAEEIRRLRKKLAGLEARVPPENDAPNTEVSAPASENRMYVNENITLAAMMETRLSMAPSIQSALVSSFIRRACPPSSTGQYQWIWPIANAANDSLMLWRALTATALVDYALATGDETLILESQYHHMYAVNQLRGQLQSPGRTKSFDLKLLFTMLILTLYEVISFRDKMTWSLHISGAGAFLQEAEFGLHNDIPEAVFDFMRLIDIMLKTVRRQKTLYANERWRTPSSTSISRGNSSISRLIDILIRCTELLERTDATQRSITPEEISVETAGVDQVATWQCFDDIEKDLINFSGPLETANWNGTPGNELDSPKSTESDIDELSTCISLSYRLVLSRVDTRPWKPSEDVLINIAAWLNKLVVKVSKEQDDTTSGLVLLFAIRPAYFTFPKGHPGRPLTKHILSTLATKFRLPVANSVIEMFPPVVWRNSPIASPSVDAETSFTSTEVH